MNFQTKIKWQVITFLALGIVQSIAASIVLNGGFEDVSVTSTRFHLSNSEFNAIVANTTAWGTTNNYSGDKDGPTIYGTLNLVGPDNANYHSPQSGNWSVVLFTDPNSYYDAISLELESPLVAGISYTLDFDAIAELSRPSQIFIGLSENPVQFGTHVFDASPSRKRMGAFYS
jgi:hypothetical protein